MTIINVGAVESADQSEGVTVNVYQQGTEGFAVTIGGAYGPVQVFYQLHPEQSRRLRKLLEDAEAKAEILTAAI